jgi:tuberculosinol/isotuberculosinol synthase
MLRIPRGHSRDCRSVVSNPGHLPSKRQIIEAYYGDYVEPLSFFIGFEPMAMFDVPLVASGLEDLYFTVSPSLYLDSYTLRMILYDHLYTRRVKDAYVQLTTNDWSQIGNFYHLNRHHVLGVGRQSAQGCWWYPVPQVELPPE